MHFASHRAVYKDPICAISNNVFADHGQLILEVLHRIICKIQRNASRCLHTRFLARWRRKSLSRARRGVGEMRKCLFSLVTVIFNARAARCSADAVQMHRCLLACWACIGRVCACMYMCTLCRFYLPTRSLSLLEIYLPRGLHK